MNLKPVLSACFDLRFRPYTTPEEFKKATIIGHCGFVLEEYSVRAIT